jgi:hypothetical protein
MRITVPCGCRPGQSRKCGLFDAKPTGTSTRAAPTSSLTVPIRVPILRRVVDAGDVAAEMFQLHAPGVESTLRTAGSV